MVHQDQSVSKLLLFFCRPDYQSEVTQVIEQLQAGRPNIEAQQRTGRAMWRDQHLDREAQSDWRDARVPPKPYVCGSDSSNSSIDF